MVPTTKCVVTYRHVYAQENCPIALHKGTWRKGVQDHVLLHSVLHGGNCSASSTANLPAEMIPRYPLAKSLGGPQSRSVKYGEEIYLIHLLGIESRFRGHPSSCLYRQRQTCQTLW